MGAAKIPIDFIVRLEWDDTDNLFLGDNKMICFQMPLEGKNFKHDNKLVFQILKLACIKSDAWTWIRLCTLFALNSEKPIFLFMEIRDFIPDMTFWENLLNLLKAF